LRIFLKPFKSQRNNRHRITVYKKGAFVAGQLSIVVKAGKDAEKLLEARIPLTEEERADLRRRGHW